MGQNPVTIPDKIYFKIGDVCEILNVQAHVLRYWETEFPMLSPQKNRSGQRTYRRRDVEMAVRIKDLLYEDLYTIAGAKKRLQKELKEGIKPDSGRSNSDGETMDLENLEELSIEDMDLDAPQKSGSVAQGAGLSAEGKEALKTLATELLELREMLKSENSVSADSKSEQ
ncbi:MAG: MerR family transcriptional regulator [Pyrinomonadaceae bacterium]